MIGLPHADVSAGATKRQTRVDGKEGFQVSGSTPHAISFMVYEMSTRWTTYRFYRWSGVWSRPPRPGHELFRTLLRTMLDCESTILIYHPQVVHSLSKWFLLCEGITQRRNDCSQSLGVLNSFFAGGRAGYSTPFGDPKHT